MSSRRKRGDPSANGTATAVLDPPPPEPTPEPPTDPPQVAPKTRPAVSYAAHSDRTTRIEVAVWARTVTVSETEEYTQYSLTVSRAWRDADGHWTGNGFYRAHDVPVLLYLVQQAHHWCLSQRTQVRTPEADGDVPF
jgi:hypothetical protein